MKEQDEARRADRVDRIVQRVLTGKRIRVNPGDSEERGAILAAVRLAGVRDAYPRMSPAFRRRLAGLMGDRAPDHGHVAAFDRRTALVAGLGLAAGALATGGLEKLGLGIGAGNVSLGGASARPARATVAPVPGRWIDVGELTAFPDGQAVRVTAGAVGAFVIRSGSNMRALSSICTDQPCELGWHGADATLVCPCHPVAFNLRGAPLGTAYSLPSLPAIQVRIQSGRVQVLGT